MIVRAFFEAVKVESAKSPYDTVHLKIFYPAKMSGSHLEKDKGIVPVNLDQAPFPVVIFFNGFNCEAQQYQWLAVKLAERGLVVVLFNWIAENFPGIISLTPGIDVAKLRDIYGTAPTAAALPALLSKLQDLQANGILAGTLDLQRVILGGHSAGGRVAIENANRSFFPQVTAAFAYGAHTAGAVTLGYEPGTILPLPDSLPLLLIGGTRDGVIANRSGSYGIDSGDATTSIIRTFTEAIAGGRNDSYLLLLEGANHFSVAENTDSITGSTFLDLSATQPQENFRLLIAEIVELFIDTHIRFQPEASTKLEQLFNAANLLIKSFERK